MLYGNILVLQASQNQYIDTTLQVTPLGKKLQTLNTKIYFADFFYVSNTNIFVQDGQQH